MGARPQGGHAVALVAVERPVNLQGLALERLLRVLGDGDLVEDVLCVKRAVVITDARVVAPDDHVCAPVVLPEERVQQRLARTGVAHVERIPALEDVCARGQTGGEQREQVLDGET